MSRSRTDRKTTKPSRRKPPAVSGEHRFANADVRRRFICDLYYFWSACPGRACHRQRRCVGDPQACFDRYWWLVPEAHKITLRTVIKARAAGMTAEEAIRAAEEEVARSAEHIARVDAEIHARMRAQAVPHDE